MRQGVLWLFVAILIYWSFKDWFVSLCGLMLLTATIGHPDMPRAMLGVPGLNPWNVVFVAIMIARAKQRKREYCEDDAPSWASKLFWLYLIIVVVAALRGAADRVINPDTAMRLSAMQFLTEYLLNSAKFIFPALLLFEACRTRQRVIIALLFVLLIPTYYAYAVKRTVPMSGLYAETKQEHHIRRRIGKKIGFHSNSVALCLSAGLWGTLALTSLEKRRLRQLLLVALALFMALNLGLTRSRAGYAAGVGVGLLFAVFMYRYLLVAIPVGLAIIASAFPGVAARATSGLWVSTASGEDVVDEDVLWAGRDRLWPIIIDDIWTNPVIGHGRVAIQRRPVWADVLMELGSVPAHPHNAYLESLHDTGAVGFSIIMAIYLTMLGISIRLCLDRRDPLFRTLGGVGLAAVSALLIMGYSGQSLLPKENNQYVWCCMGLLLRVWVERNKTLSMMGVHSPELHIAEHIHEDEGEPGVLQPVRMTRA